jgi:hypothetical protein
LALAPAFLTLILVSTPTGQPQGAPLDMFLTACALVPALLWGEGRDRVRLASGVFLVLAGGWIGGDLRLVLPGLALLALATPVERSLGQRVWALALAFPTVLLALFPWLRPEPFGALRAFWSVGPGVLALIALAFVFLVDRLLPRLFAEKRAHSAAFALAALTLAGLTARVLPPPAQALLGPQPAALGVASAPLELQVDRPVRFVAVETALLDGVEIPAGTEVAQVQLLDARGALLVSWPLLAGDDTADWAALRADVRARAGFRAPPAFAHGIAPDGRLFSARFRKLFTPPTPANVGKLVVRRSPGAAGATLLVHAVEAGA